jgi:hypothetical protein
MLLREAERMGRVLFTQPRRRPRHKLWARFARRRVILRTSPLRRSKKFATRKQPQATAKIRCLGDVPYLAILLRYLPTRAGRGPEPRPTEGGHLKGRGEPVVQPAAFYLPTQRSKGRKGCVVVVCEFRLLPETPASLAPVAYAKRKDRG